MKKQKIQVLFIGGGMTFKKRADYLEFLRGLKISIEEKVKWSGDYLKKKLGNNFEVIKPRMPLRENAKYEEWKIYFENHFPELKNNIILIGNSLGGIFLAKYLSENKFPKKLLSVYLVCPPFDNTLDGEDLVGGFKLKSDLSLIEKNSKNVNLLFSEDDDTVPVSHANKYKEKLPNAKLIIYKNKNGHFQVSEFPELIKMIKCDIKKLK